MPDDATADEAFSLGQFLENWAVRQKMPQALAEYAKALHLAFGSYILLLFCGLYLAAPLIALRLRIPFELPKSFGMVMAVGLLTAAVLSIWSKWKIYEFEIPIRGRWLLVTSFWCEAFVMLAKFGRRWWPDLPALGGLALALNVAGFIFFLFFLRSLADVVARKDLQRQATLALVAAAGAIAAFACMAVAVRLPLGMRGVARAGFLGAPPVIAICMVTLIVAYGGLLWKLGAALKKISEHMAELEEQEFSNEPIESSPAELR
jgi:hypothetical protein